nr:PREDICTED: E3 ubiquitin-protein ligase TRIM39-like [Latimeria chalumnae]|eukprot:XP_014351212.1 PREDICTED: E3 ubiquitin-protein ligase TRIM39-like [Latimeria chalumnae]
MRKIDEPEHKTLLQELEFEKMCSYSADVTLDPNTAHPWLIMSEDLKTVTNGDVLQDLPESPMRFELFVSVLASEGFISGRHYWEVDIQDQTDWELGVVKESVNRKQEIVVSPETGFWAICLTDRNLYKALTSPRTLISMSTKPKRVGMYLDYEEGKLSFYNVHEKSVLYNFNAVKFTEKIFPFFSPCLSYQNSGSTIKICSVKAWD